MSDGAAPAAAPPHRLVHLSDLHFGTVQPSRVQQLLDAIAALAPGVVVLTGDFTQRARRTQFRAAADFLAALPKPLVIAPGNHDIPLYNLPARLLAGLGGYRQHLLPHDAGADGHDAACIVALDSTRRFTVQRGHVGPPELARARAQFDAAGAGTLKIAALHHPPLVPAGTASRKRLDNGDAALQAFAAMGVDVILSGHTHVPHVQQVGGMLSVTAGSALSDRLREHANSFYALDWNADELQLVEWRHDDADRFVAGPLQRFERRRAAAPN